MPGRATAHPSPVPRSPLRIGVAALAAAVAIALGAALVTDGGDSAGSPSKQGPAASAVERSDIDGREAAERFHHRR